MLLVRQFYRYLDAGQPVEVALTAAVRWLRQLDILTFQVELASMRRALDDPAAFVLDWQASRLDGPTPFAAPHYWAAFACHGPLTV
ncbi:MAG: CHAT domain-containing protein [Anaerolineae bacterium]|nr:CHAT domain-containing protein [Anaerolineae bacterium]